MTISLSRNKTRELSAAVETLLSPLAHASAGAWCSDVNDSLRVLFDADHAVFALPGNSGLEWHGAGLDSHALSPFAKHIVQAADSAQMRAAKDPILRLWLERRREQCVDVHTQTINDRLVDRRWCGCAFFNEALVAAGMHDCFGLVTTVKEEEALIILSYGEARGSRVLEAELPVLAVLLPAFRAALNALRVSRAHSDEIARTIDSIALPMLIVMPNDSACHRNPTFSNMLLSEPERERVCGAARELGQRLLRSRVCCDTVADTAKSTSIVVTALMQYTISATYLGEPGCQTETAALVTVERRQHHASPPIALNERFGLTSREADVAHALARRLTNTELARSLGISRHTARRHTERVLSKVGVHSRRELALQIAPSAQSGGDQCD